ncbi:hypothetical protein [Mongoliibacter ruber]|uniref:Uncharacterized protein n=1 Tax=Mongoliibacter ruber TaxID=1750599 RepID=A0A2T0WNB0_9BACT|nr:hypothetical protein [Mongoliibacter ruber]PRY88187.1 hypothetical protein CLW00_105309 [Mongoliibacter ruber]
MRTLTETETQTIKTRLDRCLIAYQEIYDELLDHYISALEKVSVEDFLKVKEEVNEKFKCGSFLEFFLVGFLPYVTCY